MKINLAPSRGKLSLAGLALVVVSGLALSGCGSDNAQADSGDAMKMNAAILPSYANLAMKVGVEEGFFKGHGLDVNMVDNTDPAAQLTALGRQFDIIPSSGSYVLNAVQKNLDVTIVNNQSISTAESPGAVLVTAHPIHDYSDLKGATIGVPLLTSYSGASLQYLMQKAGLQKDDYKLVAVPYAEQLDQFKAGKIQAAMSATPFSEALKDAGYAVSNADIFTEGVRAASGDDSIEFSPNFNLATTDWVEHNPDEVKAWRAGIADSIEWLNKNPEKGKEILVDWTHMPKEMADVATPPNFNMDIDPHQFPAIWDVMTATGLSTGEYPGDKVKVYGH